MITNGGFFFFYLSCGTRIIIALSVARDLTRDPTRVTRRLVLTVLFSQVRHVHGRRRSAGRTTVRPIRVVSVCTSRFGRIASRVRRLLDDSRRRRRGRVRRANLGLRGRTTRTRTRAIAAADGIDARRTCRRDVYERARPGPTGKRRKLQNKNGINVDKYDKKIVNK